ncbi:MAG: NAD-dependent epimerase/dehydratase family protein [Candidatus Omnitrophica bacterium]|nr:NAD-dependent epimerase/dehydratase family protein [Candidatus Omnitrophota bacterium]
MEIFLTGATGFIGSHLTRKLTRCGHRVTVYIRKTSSLKFLPKKRVEVIYGDIRNYNQLQKSLKGFDIVIHNAALVSDWAKKRDFYQTNVDGTRNVLESIKYNKIKKLTFISTIGVLGEEDCLIAKDENSPYKPRLNYFFSNIFESDMNHYRITKMLAEKSAIEFCRENQIDLTVIRPAWVYGPREFHAGPFYFCKSIIDGLVAAPIGESNRFHVVYVEDLIKAVVLAIEKDLSGINIFNIGNEKPPLIKEYLGLFAKMLGKSLPASIPEVFFQPIGFCSELIYKLVNKEKSPLLTRARVKMYYCNNIYDVSKAKRKLNFVASTPLETGIEKTVRWYRQNGFLKMKG